MSKQGYATQVRVCEEEEGEEEKQWGVYAVAILLGITAGTGLLQASLHYSAKGGWSLILALFLLGSAVCFFFWTLVGITAIFQEVAEEKRLEKISQEPPALRLIA